MVVTLDHVMFTVQYNDEGNLMGCLMMMSIYRLECARLTDLLVNLREMIFRTTFMSSLCAPLQVDEEETAHEPDRPV